jgi:hypothetical protein
MTSRTRTVLACIAVTLGLAALAGPGLANDFLAALPISGQLTWS